MAAAPAGYDRSGVLSAHVQKPSGTLSRPHTNNRQVKGKGRRDYNAVDLAVAIPHMEPWLDSGAVLHVMVCPAAPNPVLAGHSPGDTSSRTLSSNFAVLWINVICSECPGGLCTEEAGNMRLGCGHARSLVR